MIGVLGTIIVGLLSRQAHVGISLVDKSLGDVVYAIMIGFLVALARPGLRPVELGIVAFFVSTFIELFQLTGIPAKLPRIFHFVLGTAFAWHDVICYAIGAAAMTWIARRLGSSPRSPSRRRRR
ncbi:hypothetical protein AKJ09_07309 [Labilithrix luteola]|uniref:DUF2809 domain-containing protein n=1 Tax=Labilithrix luteola TaxID=1391654 RepID=A0A0K1Q488_9BACT|nr:hypothetical protein AKJ09_07309 [Labilithrix luteola]